MIGQYPLQWPAHWPRTEKRHRTRALFSRQHQKTFAAVRDELLSELRLMGAMGVVLSTNVPLRKTDGLPYSGFGQPEDVGVAVYFELNGASKCFPCDKWDRVEDNLRAISLSINALRGLDRWGAKNTVDAAFQGFDALPAESRTEGWWDVLGVDRDAGFAEVTAAWKRRIKTAHPDLGGTVEEFRRVQDAFDAFTQERGAK